MNVGSLFSGDFGGIVDGGNEEGAQISVNFDTETLEVVVFDSNIPVITKTIQGFQGAAGTINNDVFVGNGEDNIFFGSFGNDTFNGEYNAPTPTSINTVDYNLASFADVGITLLSQGQIAKESSDGTDLGTDLIQNIQTIVGNESADNIINGVADGAFLDNGDNANFDIDLRVNSLIITPETPNTFFPDPVTFNVVNFNNVVGTGSSD